jgi:hypothetical protein
MSAPVDQTNPGAELTERIASIPVHVHPARIMLMREAVVGRKMAFPASLAVQG